MKKIFTLGIAFLVTAGAYSQEAVQVTKGEFWLETGGMQALGLSPNGRYISGACASWEGFVYDCVTNKLVTTGDFKESKLDETGANQFYAVTDEGVAYGWDGNGAVALGIDGTYNIIEPLGEYFGLCPKGVSADGSIVVGFYNSSFTMNKPCYWENGVMHDLEYSTSEEAGFLINGGCQAQAVSNDGSVIMGWLMTRSHTQPLVFWLRQADGTYKYVPAFQDEYEDSRDKEGNLKQYYTTRLNKLFQPACMSGDGKTIVLYIQRVLDAEDGDAYIGPEEVALYDVTEKKVKTVIPYDRDNLLYSDDFYMINGISNSGKMVGFVGIPESSTPIILNPDDYSDALMLTQAYPPMDLLEEYYDIWEEWHGLYMLTGISADGETLCGYLEGFNTEEGSPVTGGMITFYIGPKAGENGIPAIETTTANGNPVYYDLQGRRVQNPAKGIYIVRTPEGKTEKVIMK